MEANRRITYPLKRRLHWLLGVGIWLAALAAEGKSMQPKVKVVEGGESQAKPEDCRVTIVGPGINQPDPFPGYAGFVGWESPIRLKNGTWLIGFNAGYWHASSPTPHRSDPKMLEEYSQMGMPDVEAPTGGRAMIVRSTDGGKTWSKPETLIDTPADDRHPFFLELPDGTILCGFFTYMGAVADTSYYLKDPSFAHRTRIIRSFDGGRTWEKEPRLLPSPFIADEADGPMILAQDGSAMLVINGSNPGEDKGGLAVLCTKDRGETWELLAVIKADCDLSESSIAQLPNGRMVIISRPEGAICWSDDGGRTWTKPVTFGMRMYAPSLYVLPNGTLVCLHGSYAGGGLRVIFSTDGGQTWIAPAPDRGFLVDRTYGYGKGMVLPDGSLFITYLSTGGHRREDARTNSIYAIRLRVRSDHSGIDLLPAPGRN